MKFRTEIGSIESSFKIDHSQRIILLGSCFADNIGERLEHDGFQAVHNPMGPLYNPLSIAEVGLGPGSLVYCEHEGIWHCLSFANRYQDSDIDRLKERVATEFLQMKKQWEEADVRIISLGTDHVYFFPQADSAIGNCHKLPARLFEEEILTVEESQEYITDIFNKCRVPSEESDKSDNVSKCQIATLSPVRYPSYGLVESSLSKARLRIALENSRAKLGFDYFPAFEILNDDLRDYRFYADDLRHPSSMAVDYIYRHFADTYFTDITKEEALRRRKEWLRSQHRPIL